MTDSYAFKKVLASGRLSGAVIDVWENEPDIDLELMGQAFIATPHIAGYSTDGKANGTSMVVNTLCKYFNLPMVNWYPPNVPPPAFPYISIDCKDKPPEEIIREVVNIAYNIEEDNKMLRCSPSDFEKQRGDYRIRREFASYFVELENGSERIKKTIADLGFKIKI